MPVLVLCCVVILYAAVGGSVGCKLQTIHLRCDTGQLLEPLGDLSLPSSGVDTNSIQSAVMLQSFCWMTITVGTTPHAKEVDVVSVHPVISLRIVDGELSWAITNDAAWTKVSVASFLSIDASGNVTTTGGALDILSGQNVTVSRTTNLVDWLDIGTVNVAGDSNFVDAEMDYNFGSAFYRARIEQ